MAKIVLDTVTGGYDLSVINNNFDKIELELQNKVLYRDNPVGEPNTVQTDIDVNAKKLYNLPEPLLDSQAARLQDVQNAIAGGAANLIAFTPYGHVTGNNIQVAFQELIDDTTINGVVISSFLKDSSFRIVNTIADLKAVDKTKFTKIAVLGYHAANDGGGGFFLFDAADTTSVDNGGTIIVATDSGRWKRIIEGNSIPVEWFGAKGDGVTNDTVSINAAITYGSTNGKTTTLAGKTYALGIGGTHDAGTQNYCLFLKDNTSLVGEGVDKTILKPLSNVNADIIVTDKDTVGAVASNVSVSGFTLDGNYTNNPTERFGFWIYSAENLKLSDIKVTNVRGWGYRIEKTTKSFFNNLQASQPNLAAADGLHTVDCSFLEFNNILISTLGDDAFIIEALSQDVNDIVVSNLVINNSGASNGRGILLFVDDSIAATQRSIYNIKIDAITRDCFSYACVSSIANFFNLDINISDFNSLAACFIIAGASTPGFTGSIKNSVFNIKSHSARQNCFLATIVSGTISGNTLHLNGYNHADNNVGVSLIGNSWIGSIFVDDNPNGTKVSPLQTIDIHGSFNTLQISVINSSSALNFRATATYNSIQLGRIVASVNSITLLAGANFNTITGGSVSSTITNSGTSNQFASVVGATVYATVAANFATKGDGTFDYTHGLQGVPKVVTVTLFSGNSYFLTVTAITGSLITFTLRNDAGTLITTGTHTLLISAKL